MGAALGYGLTAPAWESVKSIFSDAGIGLARAFTALAFAPGLARNLPKPGPWMVSLRSSGVPMIAATVWLMWVLAQQAGANGVLYALSSMAGLGLLVCGYAYAERQTGVLWQSAADWSCVCVYGLTDENDDKPSATWSVEGAIEGEHWTRDAVDKARAGGKTGVREFQPAACASP